ncbi:hypothetical protein SteCoe_13495 [Stentor coeruleus]|uniref:Uncharacterized protein n=1 Tax=Stentor coeruleus TaxID=5963 RepID=A0A1R2C8B9_9CILI|nr:hypothetical protein SteCoe_13495 [Stentor coeruleus]
MRGLMNAIRLANHCRNIRYTSARFPIRTFATNQMKYNLFLQERVTLSCKYLQNLSVFDLLTNCAEEDKDCTYNSIFYEEADIEEM